MSPPETPTHDAATPHHSTREEAAPLHKEKETARRLAAKAKGLERVTKAKGFRKLKRPDFFRSASEVWCKLCGVEIGPGRRNHVDITIQFDDGSAHVTPLCRDCAGRLDSDDLEAIYAADILDLSKDEERAGVLMDWTLLAERKPVGFTR